MAEFEIRQSSDGQSYYFVLQADNNEIVATSERYARKNAVFNGIEAVRRAAAIASVNDTTAEGAPAIVESKRSDNVDATQRRRDDAFNRLRARFDVVPDGVSLADELIAERRDDARSEASP